MKSIANHNNDQNIFKTIFIEHWDHSNRSVRVMILHNIQFLFRRCLIVVMKAVAIVNTDALIAGLIHSGLGSVVKVVFVYPARKCMLMSL